MDENQPNLKLADARPTGSRAGSAATNENGKPQSEDVGEAAEAPILAGELITITGTLASMTHDQAYELITAHGGTPTSHLSRSTTLLIVGEEGWPLEEDGRPSAKLQNAELLLAEGHPLRIISESDWLRILRLDDDHPDVRRLYTPAMLSQLLKLPVQVIRSWERAGLIRAEKKVFRLPYFSYQEVTAARRVSELLQSGITEHELTRSLQLLKRCLPDPNRILEQLELLSDHRQLVIKDQHGYLDPQTRQRYFDFSGRKTDQSGADRDGPFEQEAIAGRVLRFDPPRPAHKSATDWMVEGCRKAEVADISGAIRCFRQALRVKPDDAEAHFYLADSLYRLGKHEAALERYLAAIEHDPEYLEAWNQIGCVYAELNKWPEAILAFDEALTILPEFAETHLHKAETLRTMKQIPEAVRHWQAYLKYDECGPWAELVHQRLEQATGEVSPHERD